jgi:hypothetical protein
MILCMMLACQLYLAEGEEDAAQHGCEVSHKELEYRTQRRGSLHAWLLCER